MREALQDAREGVAGALIVLEAPGRPGQDGAAARGARAGQGAGDDRAHRDRRAAGARLPVRRGAPALRGGAAVIRARARRAPAAGRREPGARRVRRHAGSAADDRHLPGAAQRPVLVHREPQRGAAVAARRRRRPLGRRAEPAVPRRPRAPDRGSAGRGDGGDAPSGARRRAGSARRTDPRPADAASAAGHAEPRCRSRAARSGARGRRASGVRRGMRGAHRRQRPVRPRAGAHAEGRAAFRAASPRSTPSARRCRRRWRAASSAGCAA